MEFKDYYKILGVEKSATDDDIRKAYRKLAREHHPDVAKDRARSDERIKEINEAYEVLGDKAKRKEYDELGSQWQQAGGAPPRWQGRRFGRRGVDGGRGADFEFGGTGFSDFFEMFFGERPRSRAFGGFGDFAWESEPDEQPPADIEADLMVSLEEAVRGGHRKITVRRPGERASQSYDVSIPKGVYEGQRIRLAGQGELTRRSGQRGDLYLRVKFAPHPDYRADIHGDLFTEVEVAPWTAVLGGSVPVQTLDGQVRLTIPPGTQNGTKFRFRDLGAPIKGGARGNLYAVVTIQIPSHVSAQEKKLWEQLAAGSVPIQA